MNNPTDHHKPRFLNHHRQTTQNAPHDLYQSTVELPCLCSDGSAVQHVCPNSSLCAYLGNSKGVQRPMRELCRPQKGFVVWAFFVRLFLKPEGIWKTQEQNPPCYTGYTREGKIGCLGPGSDEAMRNVSFLYVFNPIYISISLIFNRKFGTYLLGENHCFIIFDVLKLF